MFPIANSETEFFFSLEHLLVFLKYFLLSAMQINSLED